MPDAKILIISYNYPPDNAPAAQRPAAFHRYTETDSVVLTAERSFSALGSDDRVVDENNVIRHGAVDILRSNVATSVKGSAKSSWKRRLFNEIKIPDKAIVWYRPALKMGRQILKKDQTFTHIYSSSPSVVNHMVAARLAKAFKLKWIADFRDYYYIEAIERGDFIFRKRIDRWIESQIVKRADYLTFISDWMHKIYSKRYPAIKSRSCSIYNGYDPAEFEEDPVRLPRKFTVFYAGTFYYGLRSPLPLFEALDRLHRDGHIDLDLIEIKVAGRLSYELERKIMTYESGKCFQLLGLLPRSTVLDHYRHAHALWLIVGSDLNHYTGVPIKAYEYMASKRPLLIFAPSDSEVANIFRDQLSGHYFCSSDHSFGHDAVVLKAYQDYVGGLLDQNVEDSNIVNYSRVAQAKDLDRIVSEI